MKNVALRHSSFTFHFYRRRYQLRAALSPAYRQSTSDADYEYGASGGNERRDKYSEFFVTASAAFEMQALTTQLWI
jgi:hypothetical protein